MQLYTDYIQPLAVWIEVHPSLALLIAFAISFAESLAVIGSVIPGSVTMTAIGILAGSGIMRVDLTLLFATLGAIAGDSASYMLGYLYSERINTFWPFRNHPNWIAYGKNYFSRHGGKSILIGRFVGPLRSVIPVIAGMMHMNQWRFFSANAISAVGWSILYVLPGVLIGAASSELSPESATRLFAIVMFFLVGLWLLSIALKWSLVRISRFLSTQLTVFWRWAGKHRYFAKVIGCLTPKNESNHSQTAALCIGLLVTTLLFLLITASVVKNDLFTSINEPTNLFLHSLRLFSFDRFFIIANEFTSKTTLLSLMLFILFAAIYKRDWYSAYYWLSLHISCGLLLFVMYWLIKSPSPESLFERDIFNYYPSLTVTFATTQFSILLFYLNHSGKSPVIRFLNIFFPILLLIAGIAPLYLGDKWVSDIWGAYLGGFSLCLLHWIFYRRKKSPTTSIYLAPIILIILFLSSGASLIFNYEQSIRTHQPYLAQYIFTDNVWWNQKKALLPVYRTNRIGKPISFFNIQYAGDLEHLETALLKFGWHNQNESLFWSIVKRVNGKTTKDTPLLAQLYLNNKPVLVMSYQPKTGQAALILRVWRSNYHLMHFCQPIWLGTVSTYGSPGSSLLKYKQPSIPSLFYVSDALSKFTQRFIPLSIKLPAQSPYYEPMLLLIKEAPSICRKTR